MIKALVKLVLLVMVCGVITSCGKYNRPYTGPAVTSIEVHKSERRMYLLHGTDVLKVYDVHLGGNPSGPKQFEGDGKTPEGRYFITHRNAQSAYHLSLGISYPNEADKAYAAGQDKLPGGDIFIHGQRQHGSSRGDWTVGCIAVTNRQIDEIYWMVNPGTPISLYP